MEVADLQAVLEDLNFSSELPSEAVRRLAETSSLRSLSAGDIVFREGSPNRNLYLIRHGRVALEMNVPGRSRVRILTLGPGEMVGWSSLLGQGPMTATAVAVDACELILADAQSLDELSSRNPEFGYHLMRRMAEAISKRLVATRLQLLDLFSTDPAPVPESMTGDADE